MISSVQRGNPTPEPELRKNKKNGKPKPEKTQQPKI
jgi:hypothetical protein